MNTYDCDFCIANKLYESRHCFLDEYPGQEENRVTFPIFDPDDSSYNSNPIAEEDRTVDKKGIFEELETIEAVFPHLSPFEILRTYFAFPKEVCPTGLVDIHHNFILEMESSCREYSCLPYEGGLLDQPLVLNEVFHVIQSEKASYERTRMSKLQKETKNKQSSSNKPKRPQLPGQQGSFENHG